MTPINRETAFSATDLIPPPPAISNYRNVVSKYGTVRLPIKAKLMNALHQNMMRCGSTEMPNFSTRGPGDLSHHRASLHSLFGVELDKAHSGAKAQARPNPKPQGSLAQHRQRR
jgi:hypothetical protein